MRLPAVALAALLALAAGCVQEEPAEPAGTSATPGDVAAPADGEPVVDDGSKPMATDVGHMPHMHDYWMDRERVVLFDDEIAPSEDPFMVAGGAGAGSVGATFWTFPDGAIVMEGTGTLELTATYDDPLVTSIAVSYRSNANAEWSDALALANGELASIEVTPLMTDLPHQSVSRWEFAFFPDGPGTFMGPFHLRAEIVRVADIMLFPGHPELFEGKPEKVIMDSDHEHTEQSYAARAPQVVTEGGFQEKFVAPEELVPMETKAMRIELDILEATSTPGEVAEIRFFYRGADTSFIGHPTVLPLEGSLDEKRLVYQFPVAPEQTDTPYGEESQWLFFVEPAVKITGAEEEPTCGGCTDVSIKYHLKVIVYDHELEEYSNMEGDE